jgi:hypothetical protein
MARSQDGLQLAYSLTKRLNQALKKAHENKPSPIWFEIEGGSHTDFRVVLRTKLGGRLPLWNSAKDEEAEKKEVLRRAFYDLDVTTDALREAFEEYEKKQTVAEPEEDEDDA